MSSNLIDMFKDKVSGGLSKHAAGFLGEGESEMSTAVNGSFATLMASLIEKGKDKDGAKELHKIVKNSDDDILEDIEQIFTRSPQTVNGLVNIGTRELPKFLGGRQREATNLIAADSGIKKNASSKLMKIVTPFFLGMIGKKVRAGNLDEGGMMNLINGMKGDATSGMPEGMTDVLELSSFGWTKKAKESKKDVEEKARIERAEKKRAARAEKEAAAREKKDAALAAKQEVEAANAATTTGGFKWWWAILPLLLIGLLWLLIGRGCSGAEQVSGNTTMAKTTNTVVNGATTVTTAASNVVEATTEAVSNTFGNVNEAAKSALSSITFAAGSAGNQMMDFIKDGDGEGRFRFTNLTFDTGSAAIAGESGLEVDNIAAILKAYPDVKINVEGYTDNRGNADSNVKLSRQRAQAVRKRLVSSGIKGNRMKVEGFGDANPVADNETAEGRAQNRRIEVTIQK